MGPHVLLWRGCTMTSVLSNGRLKQVFIHCAPIAVAAIYGAHVVEKTIYQLLAVIPFSGIFSKMKHPVLYPELTGPNTLIVDRLTCSFWRLPLSKRAFSCSIVPSATKFGYLSSFAEAARVTASVSIFRRDDAMSRSCPDTCTRMLILGRTNSSEEVSFRSITRPCPSRTGSTPSILNACATVAPCEEMNSPAQNVKLIFRGYSPCF